MLRGADRGGRNREEVAVERLEVGEDARLQIALIRQPDRARRRSPTSTRVVGFGRAVDRADLAVVALFAEVAAAEERVDAARRRCSRA